MNPDLVKEKLAPGFGSDSIEVQTALGQVVVTVPSQKVVQICKFLRDEPGLNFNYLSFVAGVDRLPENPRFEIIYQLYSTTTTERLRLKTRIDENDSGVVSVDSVCEVWASADWHERETSEMFGITFNNHPDPRKLLLPDEWTVHPLRKDFPLSGTDQDTPDLPK